MLRASRRPRRHRLLRGPRDPHRGRALLVRYSRVSASPDASRAARRHLIKVTSPRHIRLLFGLPELEQKLVRLSLQLEYTPGHRIIVPVQDFAGTDEYEASAGHLLFDQLRIYPVQRARIA